MMIVSLERWKKVNRDDIDLIDWLSDISLIKNCACVCDELIEFVCEKCAICGI